MISIVWLDHTTTLQLIILHSVSENKSQNWVYLKNDCEIEVGDFSGLGWN